MYGKDYRLKLDNWLQAEEEFSKVPDFEEIINRLTDKEMKHIPYKGEVERDNIVIIKKIEYIKRRAYFISRDKKRKRQKWIAECAYYLSLKNPSNSTYANWCQAASEYDNNLRSKQ